MVLVVVFVLAIVVGGGGGVRGVFLGEVKTYKQKHTTDKPFITKPRFTRHAGKAGGFVSWLFLVVVCICLLCFFRFLDVFVPPYVPCLGFSARVHRLFGVAVSWSRFLCSESCVCVFLCLSSLPSPFFSLRSFPSFPYYSFLHFLPPV